MSGDDDLIVTSRGARVPSVADEYGNAVAYGTTDNAASNFALDDRIVEFVDDGVLNGSFSRGPQDSTGDITDINALPDWTGPVQVSGGAITCQWVTDASSPSGHNLRFNINPGAASDEAYVQQIIPVGGDRKQAIAHVVRAIATFSAPSSFTAKVAVQYLDANLATVGSEYTNTGTGNTGTLTIRVTGLALSAAPPATARWLRIRLHAMRDSGAAADSGFIDYSGVRVAHGVTALLVGDTYSTTVYFPTYITQQQGILTLGVGTTTAQKFIFVDSTNLYIDLNDFGGIKFPATQVASADANTLDDYEEGTFTPGLAYATPGTSSWATTTALGWYTKIGNRVHFHFIYNGVPTNGTAAGTLSLTGLPFTVQNTASSGARFACEFQGYTKANFTQITGFCTINTTQALFRASGSGQTTANLAVGDIPTGGTVIVAGGGHYFV